LGDGFDFDEAAVAGNAASGNSTAASVAVQSPRRIAACWKNIVAPVP